MKYITIKRTRIKGVSGEFNLPYGTEVKCIDGVLFYGDKPICSDHSQNAYDYFTRNDDNNGLERGKLTQLIRKTLEKRDKNYQVRWDKIWSDHICNKYKRNDYDDYWLWNYNFYNAELSDLVYIKKLIGA